MNCQDLVVAPDVAAELGRPVLQHLLGLRLRDRLRGLVRAVEQAEVHRQAAEVPQVADVDVTEPAQQPALVEYLHRAGGESEAARLAGSPG